MEFVAIDFETANFKRQSVCSIGLAFVKNFEIVKSINKLIKPIPNYFETINMSIHGITPEMTENEPTFSDIWHELKPYINDQQLVAHNASFDFSALRYVLDSYNLIYPTLDYYCSMLLSKKVFPGLINYQLPTVSNHLGINNLTHHDAESDAVTSAKVMTAICKKHNVNSLDELSQILGFSKGKIYPNSYRPFSCNVKKMSGTKQQSDIVSDTTEFDKEHPFYGKHVVFTGALKKLSRNDAKQIVANIGGIIKPENLSSKTNYLVVGIYDYNKYGEGYKSEKMKQAEKLIAQGKDLEIISETDFFKMVHSEKASFEIRPEQIEKDSESFLTRNKYNDLSNKKVYFSSDLSIEKTTAFQHVGNCGGYGHDYDKEEIPDSDYFVVSDKLIEDLKKGIKSKSIIDFEKLKNKAQNRGDLHLVKLLSESAFLEYIERRIKFQRGEIKMAVHEWEIEK
jgi:DNA polymerase-3 subunit epsilon